MDGDGCDDVAMGGPGFVDFPMGRSGRVRVISAVTGALILERTGEGFQSGFGPCAGCGDVDGDGFADLLMGEPGYDTWMNDVGRALVVSGATGGTLRTIIGASVYTELGQIVANAGDLTGDSHPELLVGIDSIPQFCGASLTFGSPPAGTAPYGRSSGDCEGDMRLVAAAPATIGNADFSISCLEAPHSAPGTVFFAPIQAELDPAVDLYGIGLPFHVDVMTPLYGTASVTASPAGFASVALPIPDLLSVIGFSFCVQTIWFAGTGCPGAAFGYVTTNGLEIAFQDRAR